MNTREIQENLEMAQNILGLWLRYRQFYLKGISSEPISPEDESQFLSTTSTLAQTMRKLAQRVDEKKYMLKQNDVSALLKRTISIQYFRNLSPADQKAFYREWHTCAVYLSRAVGTFKFLSEGYVPPPPKPVAGKGGKGKGKSKLPVPLPVLIGGAIVLIVGAVFFLS